MNVGVTKSTSNVYNSFRIFDVTVFPFDVGLKVYEQFDAVMTLGLAN